MMSVMLGNYALGGAMLAALAVVAAVVGYVGTKNEGLLRGVRLGMALIAGLLSVSCWGLLTALLDDHFAVAYVAQHSEKLLPLGYKIAAFWAGQAGSLLLWAWMIAVVGLVMTWQSRRKNQTGTAIALGVMAGVTFFFTCVMLFAGSGETSGNPFEAAAPGMDGEGLNPVLQNWMMVIHPPLLFLGYAVFTAPFALMLGALWGGSKKQEAGSRNGARRTSGGGEVLSYATVPVLNLRQDDEWLRQGRGWMVFSWVALTVGIVLGSQWAYMVLGWGGYWGWDPVENASLLPWLTGTALLHSAMLAQRRGIFKRWTASLTAASFFMCVFGTYLTRSGVVQSVHTFGDSPIGTFFLVFLIVIGVVSVGTILWRLNWLKGERAIEDLLSREGMILGGNVLLSVMTGVVIVGTMFEKISGWLGLDPITAKPEFYDRVVLPMALALAALMATGPVVGFGAGSFGRVKGKLLGMAGVGVVAAVVVGLLGYRAVWALAVAWVAGAVVTGIAIDVTAAMRGGVKGFAARPRHWGAQLAHLGLAVLVIGVAGSSLYGVKAARANSLMLKMGGAEAQQRVGPYTLSLRDLKLDVRGENYTTSVATILVKKDGGESFELKPEQRFYDRGSRPGQPVNEVAIRFGVLSDVYLNLAGVDEENGAVAMEVFINPLVNWIWVGAALMTLGGLVCLIPGKREGSSQEAVEEAGSQKPEARIVGGTARERRRAMGIVASSLAGKR